MKPSEIHFLLTQAKAARDQSPAGIHTFALYWITWEAYRTRMLAVAARLRGWRIEDAYYAIGARQISSQGKYKQWFKAIADVQLAEQPGLLGTIWNLLDEIEILRHRLVHGYRSANPNLIEQAIQFLDRVLTHPERIFSKLKIPSIDPKNPTSVMLGNVLAQRPGSGRGITIKLDRQSLMEKLNLEQNRKPARLPDAPIIQRLAKAVEKLG